MGGALADDAMMAKRDETPSAADIWKVSEKDGTERLGPTGRRWTALWRAVYGARLGCYNKKLNHGKRGTQAGTFAAAKAGVLAAAEYAVAMGLSGTA